MIGRIRPSVVVGFGGYPTVPPLFAASLRSVPSVLHEQNGVMGRANRLLAPRVTAIATGFRQLANLDPRLQGKVTFTGNPVRALVIEAANVSFAAPEPSGHLRVLVFGGSQGARVMSEVVPAAVERMRPDLRARLHMVQQARAEDVEAVRAAYARLGVAAECEPFFSDLPIRMAAAHLVISRSGASTVAELAAIGRPAILVPLPHALDQDQFANAGVLAEAGGAVRIEQRDFTPRAAGRRNRRLGRRPGPAGAHGQGRQIGRHHRRRRALGGFGDEGSGNLVLPAARRFHSHVPAMLARKGSVDGALPQALSKS